MRNSSGNMKLKLKQQIIRLCDYKHLYL